jgi:hypothetical protein
MNAAVCRAAAAACLALSACAQVPRETIDLADTVGRDVAAIEKGHRQFVELVYDSYEKDVNEFVDKVYLPYYVRENLRKPSGKQLLGALQQAAQPGATPQQQIDAFETAELWLQVAHESVAGMRQKLLAPLKAQRQEILEKLAEAYGRVHKANAAMSGYLASLARVTDVQNDLLARLGVPDLGERVGDAAVEVSAQLDRAIPAAERRLAQAEAIKGKLEEYLKKWRTANGDSR